MLIALDERFRSIAHEHLEGHEVVFFDSGIAGGQRGPFVDRDEFVALAREARILGCCSGGPWPFDEEVITRLPRLQFIHKIGAGIDWFDVDALTGNGILLATNAGLNAVSVADHLVMLALICLRSAIEPILSLRQGVWMFVPPHRIVEVEDATFGIIGFGRIGAQVANRLRGFGEVRILAHQRRPLDPASSRGVIEKSLEALLSDSDVVIVAVPLTQETRGLIGAREIALMKEGAILVNASRGRIVDQAALYEALTSGHLSSAASDVFDEEPTPADNPLLGLPNFIGTPHMAGRSRRNSPRQLSGALENIKLFMTGRRPERLVNGEILDNGTARCLSSIRTIRL